MGYKSALDLIDEAREEIPEVIAAKESTQKAIETAQAIVYKGETGVGDLTIEQAIPIGFEVGVLLEGFTTEEHRRNALVWADQQPSEDIRLYLRNILGS